MNTEDLQFDRRSPPARRVLWVSTSRQTTGGMTTFVNMLSNTPLWQAWNVDFVATHRGGSSGVRIITFFAGFAAFVWRIARRRVSLVHLHTSHYGSFPRKGMLLWIATAVGVPVVLQVHAGEFPVFYRRMPSFVRWLIRCTLSRADTVVALGENCASQLRAIAPSARVVSISNGVRITDEGSPTGRSGPVHVVFLGRMCEAKGTFVLLDAWARLHTGDRGLPAARLTIAGDGDVDGVRACVSRLGIGDSVDVKAWLSPPEVAALLRAADVLALPSRFEGQPMAVLEAMAHGLCIVASPVGGICDLLEDGTSGVLVPPDDVDRLTHALRTVVADGALRARLGGAALARARDRFDIEVVWRRFDGLYRDLLAGKRSDSHERVPGGVE
jgi:glycosyltransferase involved in cell wall biosynthesis